MVEPLKELVFSQRAGSSSARAWVDGLRLLCTVYDPASGRYRFDYSVFVAAAIGSLCLSQLISVIRQRQWCSAVHEHRCGQKQESVIHN